MTQLSFIKVSDYLQVLLALCGYIFLIFFDPYRQSHPDITISNTVKLRNTKKIASVSLKENVMDSFLHLKQSNRNILYTIL